MSKTTVAAPAHEPVRARAGDPAGPALSQEFTSAFKRELSQRSDAPSPDAWRAYRGVVMNALNIEDLQNLSKQQIETATAFASTLTKGLQELAAETADYSKTSMAHSAETVEKLMGAKSLETAIDAVRGGATVDSAEAEGQRDART